MWHGLTAGQWAVSETHRKSWNGPLSRSLAATNTLSTLPGGAWACGYNPRRPPHHLFHQLLSSLTQFMSLCCRKFWKKDPPSWRPDHITMWSCGSVQNLEGMIAGECGSIPVSATFHINTERTAAYPTYMTFVVIFQVISSAKYLGVNISDNLEWYGHIDKVAKKANWLLPSQGILSPLLVNKPTPLGEKKTKKDRKREMNLPGKETILICFATETTTIRRSRVHGGIFFFFFDNIPMCVRTNSMVCIHVCPPSVCTLCCGRMQSQNLISRIIINE